MERILLAKTLPNVQSIEQHTNEALKHFEELKRRLPNILTEHDFELLRLAVLYHDLGKANEKFQNKLMKNLKIDALYIDHLPNQEEIPHNYLSGGFIDIQKLEERFSDEDCKIICMSIFLHHTRKTLDMKTIKEYIQKGFEHYRPDFGVFAENIISKPDNKYFRYIDINQPEVYGDDPNLYKRYVLIKGLLNRVDYAASADIKEIEENIKDNDGFSISDRVQQKYTNLKDVQKFMLINKNNNLIVTAATGIGKTEAALLWINNSKGFYTLPLKVSVNAIFDRVEKKLGYENKAALLHSDAKSEFMKQHKDHYDDEQILDYITAATQFCKPLTFCTVDQIFKFIFKHIGSEHVLATLSYSKVVIDEIQMYSPQMVAMLLVGVKTIIDFGGKVAIITATFPPILYKFLDGMGVNIVKSTKNLDVDKKLTVQNKKMEIIQSDIYQDLTTPSRHRIKFFENEDINVNMAIELAKKSKVLILTNTVSHAQILYDNLYDSDIGVSVQLLHSKYIKRHRAALEADILSFAPNGSETDTCGIWISTQIVEASLDIDFDFLFTEMCTIDSLLQRMGRVYRNRHFIGELPNVFIFDNRNGVGKGKMSVIDNEIYEFSKKAVMMYDGRLLMETPSQDDKQKMIRLVYDVDENPQLMKSNYYRDIQYNIDKIESLLPFTVDKKDTDEMFRGIDSLTVIPVPVFKELQKDGKIQLWEEQMKEIYTDKGKKKLEKLELLNEIFSYTVSLSFWREKVERKKNSGIDLLDKYEIYVWECEYDFKQDTETGKFFGKGITHTNPIKKIEDDNIC